MNVHASQHPPHPVLSFVWRGDIVRVRDVPPTRTLLQLLRQDLNAKATKEGCNEGDCGACTVVLAEPEGERLRYRAVNSCIRLAHSIHGMALWTAADLPRTVSGEPHPIEQALLQHHASQCGFCTPGFSMSLFALAQEPADGAVPQTERILQAFSGNLCRCTGYRPLLAAAAQVLTADTPRVAAVDEPHTLSLLKQIKSDSCGLEADFSYCAPTSLADLLQARRQWPQAAIVAGCTDVGLWINKQHRRWDRVLDVTRVAELRQVQPLREVLRIGAAVPLTDAFAALARQRPQLQDFFQRFAGQPVRNAGTLGGNVANASPIGDSMPLLIALGARVLLASAQATRSLPLEDFYLGYRQTALNADEVVVALDIPSPSPGEAVAAYKISKRWEDDISAVCLAVWVRVQGDRIATARLGAGGVAAIPARARATEAVLIGQAHSPALWAQAAQTLMGEFSPLTDMRASAAYRREMLGQLLRRFGATLGASDSGLARLQPVVADESPALPPPSVAGA